MTLPLSPKNHLKRTHSDAGLDNPLPNSIGASTTLAPLTLSNPELGTRNSGAFGQATVSLGVPSPANPTIEPATALNATNPPITASSSLTNPTKKHTKLTESEKEAKRREKEAKEQEKAKQKAKKEEDRIRKEEEKAKRDEERRVKDAEKEKRRQEKEEQTRLKEEEKRKKEEEKDKKQKSQLRLNAFFAPPSFTNDESTALLPQGSPSPVNSRRSSIVSLHNADTPTRERSTSATPSKPKLSEYARRFPPFFVHSHTTLAPPSRFERDEQGLDYMQRNIDEKLSDLMNTDFQPSFNPAEMLHLSPYKRRKIECPQPCVKEIVERLHGTSQNPIDLTDSRRLKASQTPLDLLKTVPTRFLKFAEDVRPPYVGTYTKVQDSAKARKICRNPFSRSLPYPDYDYDSEAEWEEPGEGEDLDSEAEEEIESEDGDDMEGFLDDEDAADAMKALQKRRLVTGNLEPTSTGLCWEHDENYQALRDLAQYRLEVILAMAENPKTPIDPYSTAYWPNAPSSTVNMSSLRASQSIMDPPRIPLSAINRNNLSVPDSTSVLEGMKPQNDARTVVPSRVSKPPKRIVAPDVLEDFKRAVNGSDLTKAGLIEILKKQYVQSTSRTCSYFRLWLTCGCYRFPKQSKDAIKDTLGIIAERVGVREKDKRWVVKSQSRDGMS
ncbi:MAG: hypothetical protein Q9166_005963 [cf. Caloplaca sp. 2 TL-2023]